MFKSTVSAWLKEETCMLRATPGQGKQRLTNAFQISCRFLDLGSGESGALRAGLPTCSVGLCLSDLDDVLLLLEADSKFAKQHEWVKSH